MYNFKYVSKEESEPVKQDLISLIRKVQDLVREHFTFQFRFIEAQKEI